MPNVFIERKNKVFLDVLDLQNQGYTDIHFKGFHLTGGIESSNPLSQYFFGELDFKSNIGLDESVPIYYFSPKMKHII